MYSRSDFAFQAVFALKKQELVMPLVKEVVVMAALLSDQITFEQHAGRPPVYPVSNGLYGIVVEPSLVPYIRT